jgi:hypothetical protein
MAGGFFARARRRIHPGIDGPPARQDHDRCVGDGACRGVPTRFAVRHRMSDPKPERGRGVRRVREAVFKTGGTLKTDNVYRLGLENGSRVLALPGSDDSVRGLTVDGWIVADEAARISADLISALRPMRARKPQARLAMLSTAWSRTDPFWLAWDGDDPSWMRLQATADTAHYDPDFLERERRALGDDAFRREYFGIPLGAQASPFTWELYDRATTPHVPLVAPGGAFAPPLAPAPVPVANPFRALQPLGGQS